MHRRDADGSSGDFSSIIRSDDRARGLPETPSELYAYDAIILSNVPREALGPKHMGWVEEWIGRRGGGLGMVGGPNSFGSVGGPTPRSAGCSRSRSSPAADWDESPAAIRPVAEGAIHPIWHIAADDSAEPGPAQDLAELPRPQQARPRQAQRRDPGQGRLRLARRQPGLAVQPYGRGRTMALATGITRRFAADFSQSWGVGDARYYKKFWRNAAYWLTENSSIGRRRLLAETDKRLYRPGESIVLKARAFDENAAPTLDYRVAVSIEPRSAAASTSDNSPLRKPGAGPAPGDARAPLLPWGEEFDLIKLVAEKSYTATLPIADGKDLPPASR